MEAIPRPAATILLLRDGPEGVEVFMVVRHQAIDFAGGALVFPGGRVEESDQELAERPEDCPNPDRLGVEALAFRVAAIRETFEECGVLLARPRGSAELYASGYDNTALDVWAGRINAWARGEEPADAERVGGKARSRRRDVFVYFDNDKKVRAPANAMELIRRLRS